MLPRSSFCSASPLKTIFLGAMRVVDKDHPDGCDDVHTFVLNDILGNKLPTSRPVSLEVLVYSMCMFSEYAQIHPMHSQ